MKISGTHSPCIVDRLPGPLVLCCERRCAGARKPLRTSVRRWRMSRARCVHLVLLVLWVFGVVCGGDSAVEVEVEAVGQAVRLAGLGGPALGATTPIALVMLRCT